jgi:TPR repeat protein
MKATRVGWMLLLLLLGVAPLQLPAQGSEAARKRFEEIKARAEKGDAQAQCDLGSCYYSGEGVARDAGEGVKWFRKAAEQGHAEGQYNLGVCYYRGEGVARDYVEAFKWASLAWYQDVEEAEDFLAMLDETMMREQIAEAERLAWEFKPHKASEPGAPPSGQPAKP